MNLENAHVLLTGASGGLGSATARALIARGAVPILSGRNPRRLQQLADSAGVSARQLSALLAQQGTSFYQLLHEERIALARQLLSDPAEQRSSVEAIGLEVGYRSRSTFYEAFRKATGMSPAEFRRLQAPENRG